MSVCVCVSQILSLNGGVPVLPGGRRMDYVASLMASVWNGNGVAGARSAVGDGCSAGTLERGLLRRGDIDVPAADPQIGARCVQSVATRLGCADVPISSHSPADTSFTLVMRTLAAQLEVGDRSGTAVIPPVAGNHDVAGQCDIGCVPSGTVLLQSVGSSGVAPQLISSAHRVLGTPVLRGGQRMDEVAGRMANVCNGDGVAQVESAVGDGCSLERGDINVPAADPQIGARSDQSVATRLGCADVPISSHSPADTSFTLVMRTLAAQLEVGDRSGTAVIPPVAGNHDVAGQCDIGCVPSGTVLLQSVGSSGVAPQLISSAHRVLGTPVLRGGQRMDEVAGRMANVCNGDGVAQVESAVGDGCSLERGDINVPAADPQISTNGINSQLIEPCALLSHPVADRSALLRGEGVNTVHATDDNDGITNAIREDDDNVAGVPQTGGYCNDPARSSSPEDYGNNDYGDDDRLDRLPSDLNAGFSNNLLAPDVNFVETRSPLTLVLQRTWQYGLCNSGSLCYAISGLHLMMATTVLQDAMSLWNPEVAAEMGSGVHCRQSDAYAGIVALQQFFVAFMSNCRKTHPCLGVEGLIGRLADSSHVMKLFGSLQQEDTADFLSSLNTLATDAGTCELFRVRASLDRSS